MDGTRIRQIIMTGVLQMEVTTLLAMVRVIFCSSHLNSFYMMLYILVEQLVSE